jgi:hypothetical protein
MKLKYLTLLTLLFLLPIAVKADAIDQIAQYFKQGNAHELGKLFASSVELNMLEETNVYSQAQAEMILDKFFKENKPLSAKVLHRVSSNPHYNYAVLILNTERGKYRVSYTLKDVNKVMVVIEMHIETEKT